MRGITFFYRDESPPANMCIVPDHQSPSSVRHMSPMHSHMSRNRKMLDKPSSSVVCSVVLLTFLTK